MMAISTIWPRRVPSLRTYPVEIVRLSSNGGGQCFGSRLYPPYAIGRAMGTNPAPADFYPLCIEDDVDTSVRNVLG